MNHNAEPTIACLTDAAPEQMLVVAAKNGDEEAMETLFRRHRQKILQIVLRYAHVREDAEDIVQKSFQKAFVYLHKFEGKSSFSTWLTRIAINESLMLLRHGRALREVSVDDHSEAEGSAASLEISDSNPDPEASYLQWERAQILSEALGNLRPGMRKAIELRELAELSTEQTAEHMGLSVGAVKARIFHGRRKLRERLRRCMTSPRALEKGSSRHGGAARISRGLRTSVVSA
jgi:RNA polymerase sigma-70 factor (ECF subfamily)